MLAQWNQECSLSCQYPQIFIFSLFTWNFIVFHILLSEEACLQVKFIRVDILIPISLSNVTLHCSKEFTLSPKLYSHIQYNSWESKVICNYFDRETTPLTKCTFGAVADVPELQQKIPWVLQAVGMNWDFYTFKELLDWVFYPTVSSEH